MNNKTLGTLALIGAPTMLMGTYLEMYFPPLANSWFTGVWGLLYITPWMGMMVAVKRSGILGKSRLGKAMPWVLLVTLTLADISNLFWFVDAANRPAYFFYIDLFWPLSHTLMLVVGVLALTAKRLQGWRRFVPLAMGAWLPLALGTLALLGRTPAAFFIGGVYNAVVVLLLALVVRSLPGKEQQPVTDTHGFQPVLH